MSTLYVNNIYPASAAGTIEISGSRRLDVTMPDAVFTGNLVVSGTFDANVQDFKVTANTMTFGDAAGDSLTFNASTASVSAQGLNFDSNTFVIASHTNRVGVGVAAPTSTLDVNGVVKSTGFTIGSAVINEADLEKIDGISDGTAAANKALVLDSHKAIGTISHLTASNIAVGSTVLTDDSIVMTPSANDTVTIAASTNGALSITTVDTADNAANVAITADGTFEVDAIAITLDSTGDIVLDADGDQVSVKFGGAAGQIDFTNENSGDGVIQQKVDTKDLVVKQYDGTEVARFTDAGHVEVKDNLLLTSDNAQFKMGVGSDFSIIHDGTTGATISGNPLTIDSGGDIILDADGADILFADDSLYFGGISNVSSNLQISASVVNKDITFVGSDAGSAVTALTLDMSEAGTATFNNDIKLGSDSSVLSLGAGDDFTITHDGTTGATIAGTPITINSTGNLTLDSTSDIVLSGSSVVRVENDLKLDSDSSVFAMGLGNDVTLTHDGTTGVTIAANPITLDSGGDIILDADGGDLIFKDNGLSIGGISNSSSDLQISASVGDKDIKFVGSDGGSAVTALTLDMSDAGTATFNNHVNIGTATTTAYTLSLGTTAGSQGTTNVTNINMGGSFNNGTTGENAKVKFWNVSSNYMGIGVETDCLIFVNTLAQYDWKWQQATNVLMTLDGGTGVLTAQGFDASDGNITNVGDINCDSISVDAASTGLNIDFSGANTTKGLITVADNLAAALTFKEGSNTYFTVVSTDDEEGLYCDKPILMKDDVYLHFGTDTDANMRYDEAGVNKLIISGAAGGFDINMTDNIASGFEITEGSNSYLKIVTTNNSEGIHAAVPVLMLDDQAIYFGSDTDASIFYNEADTNKLIISGAAGGFDINMADNVASGLTISETGNAYMTFVTTNSSERVKISQSTTIIDDKKLFFGTGEDWSIEYDEDGDDALKMVGTTFEMTTDTATFTSANQADPLVVIKNTTNHADGPRLRFVSDKGAAGADNDVCGIIEFYGDDDNQDNILFAKIEGIVADASNGDECGKLVLSVAENDGTNTAGLTITGTTTDDRVNVQIANDLGSVTTVKGGLTVEGPMILEQSAVSNLSDDSSIPVTNATARVDANGSARTGIRFSGAGTAGQFLTVINTGGENLTFHPTEGTALIRGTNTNKDTIRPGEAHLFISDGSLWNHVGGGTTDEGGGMTPG